MESGHLTPDAWTSVIPPFELPAGHTAAGAATTIAMVMIDMTNDCLIAWAPAHTNEHITSVAYVLRRPCCYRVRNLWFIAARKSPGLVCQELCNIAECKCRILTYTAATSDEYETTKSKIFHLLIPTMSLFVRSCRYKIGHALQNRWGWGGTCIRLFFFFWL